MPQTDMFYFSPGSPSLISSAAYTMQKISAATVTSHRSNFQNCSLPREKGSPNLKTEVQLPSVFLNINLLKEIDLELSPAKLVTRLFSFVKCPLSLAVCAGSPVQPVAARGISLQWWMRELVQCAGPFHAQTLSRATRSTSSPRSEQSLSTMSIF